MRLQMRNRRSICAWAANSASLTDAFRLLRRAYGAANADVRWHIEMPYFDVRLNGVRIACAGAEDIGVLGAHVILGSEGPVSLSVQGTRLIDKDSEEFVHWVQCSLRAGEKVEITYLDGNATPPISRTVHSRKAADVAAEIATVEAELAALSEELARIPPPKNRATYSTAPRPKRLDVSTSLTKAVRAELGEEEQLQAVLNLLNGKCVFEVDSITVLDSGNTKGTRWLNERLSPGQRIEVAYAI